MFNELIIKYAEKAIDKGEKKFMMGESMEFFVEKKSEHQHQLGEMPYYFTYEGERWVIYMEPDKTPEDD